MRPSQPVRHLTSLRKDRRCHRSGRPARPAGDPGDRRGQLRRVGGISLLHLRLVAELDRPAEPSPFRPVVEKATEQSPGKRHQTVKDFLTAVENAVNAPATQWETPKEAAKKLIELVCKPHGYESLSTFLTWAERLDEESEDDMVSLAEVMPALTSSSIAALLDNDEDAFLRIYRRFTDHVTQAEFAFEHCDRLAGVCKRVVRETGGPAVLRQTVAALVELGTSHNRWYVRDVLAEILQAIREPEPALAALEGLRDSRVPAVRWSLENFTIRSLHPNLRGGVEAILESNKR